MALALHKESPPVPQLKLHRAKRVLLVEDDRSLEPIFDSMLFDIDSRIEMDWVTNAEIALNKIEEASAVHGKMPFDLIILDIFLDGRTTGIDLWNLCQSIYPGMPAVVMSGLPLHKLYDFVGMNSICPPYLQKPLKLSQCRQTLKGLLDEYG